MLASLFADLGPWNWMVWGAVLLGIEILAPGFFLVWVGLAALVTGALTLQLQHVSFWVWQAQVVLFLILSVVFAYGGSRMMHSREESDQPLLNRRGEQMIGRTAVLDEPIAEGRGRIRLDDTVWRVQGPDLAAGLRVEVVAVQGNDLVVRQA